MFGDAKEENNDYQHRLRSSCLHATACALRIQQDLPNHTMGDVCLTLHIGLATGHVHSMHVGGVKGSWKYLVAGEPFVHLGSVVEDSKTGEVVMCKRSRQLVSELVVGEVRGELGNFLVKDLVVPDLLRLVDEANKPVSSASTSVSTSSFSSLVVGDQKNENAHEEKKEETADHKSTAEVQDTEQTKAEPEGGGAGEQGQNNHQALRRIMQEIHPIEPFTNIPESMEQNIWRYINDAVKTKVKAHGVEGFVWLNELRTVTILFMKFSSLMYDVKTNSINTEMVQNVLCIIQDIVYKFEGILCQMLTDDKGTILIATFGAVATHEDNPIRAVEAGLQIHNRLKINERIENSIGITTGKVFCGMVGSTVRREYTLIGDTVNLAARLMCAAEKGGNGLLCDGNTFKASKFGSRIQFVELPPVKVKGKDTMIAIFKPRALRKQSVVEGMWKGSKSDSSFSVTRQLLSSMATAEMMRSVPSSSPSSNSLAVPVSPSSSSNSAASSAASMMKPTSGATAAYTYSRPVENTMATMQSNRMLAKNVSVVRMVGGNMVGRDKEQALLKGALMRLNQSGQGGVVVVQGAAGMGKSILLNYLMDMCELHGTEYFVAATDSVERNTPFLVWSGIFHVMLQCYTYKDKEQRTRFLADRYEQIEAIFSPEKRMTPFFSLLNPMLNVDFPELEQVAMHKKDRKWNTEVIHELLWWFIAIQTQNFSKPLIIVLDDCQWMDRASLAFTLHFAKELEVVDNVMLVLALRPLTNETHLLRLITIKNAIRIDLEALNDDHIFKIIEQRYNKLLRMESKRKAEEAHLKKRFEEEERKQQQQQGEPLEDKTKNRNNKSKKRQNKDETSGTSSAGTGQEFSLSSARVRMERNESDDLEEEVEQEIDDTNNKEEASSDSRADVRENALTITKQQAQPTITTTEATANEEQKTPISTPATVTTKTRATFKEPPTASEKKRSASHRLRRAQTVHASMEGSNASANSTNAVPHEQLRPSLGSSIEPRRSNIASSSSSSIPPPPPPPPAPLVSNSNNSKKKKKNKSVRNHKPVSAASTVDKDKKQQQSSPLSSVRAASPPLSPSLDVARKTGIKGAVIFKNEENSNNDSTNNNPTTSPTSNLLASSTNSPATSASGKQRTSQFAAGSKAHKQSLPNVHSPQDNPTQLPSPSLIPRQQQEQPQRKSSLLPSSTTTRASSSSSQHPAPPPPPSPPPLPSASSSTTSNDNNFAKLLQLGKRALRKRSTATSTASASSTIASHSAIDKAQRKREKQEQKMKEKETKREKKLLEQEAKKESQAKRKRSNSSYTKRIKTSSGSEKDENEEEIDYEERLARRNRRISPPSSLHRSTLSSSHSDNSNLQEKFNSLNKPRERFKVNLFSSGIINSEEARLGRHNPIVEDIIKKSQGNPFFAEELTTAMLDKLRKETRRSSKDPSTNNNKEEAPSLSSRSTSSSTNNNKATTLSSLTASGPLKQVKLKHKKKQQQQLPKDDSFIDRASSLRASALPVKHSADALLRSGEGGGADDDRQARRRSWNSEVALHPSLQEVQQQNKKVRSGSNPSVASRDREEGGTTKPKVKKGASYIEPSSHEAGEENLLSPRRKERSLTMMSKKEMKTLEKQEKKEQKKKDKEKKRTLLASQQQLQKLQLLQRPSLASNNSSNNSTNKNILESIKGIAPVGEEELEELLRLEEENEASDDKNQDREDAEEKNERQKNLKSSLDLPEGIQDLMVARIDKLTPSLQLIVKIASVIGHEFDLNTLLEIFPLKESRMAMRHNLTLLEKLDIISKKPCPAYREEGGKSDDNELYQFVHLIFFEVCYNVMTFAQRTRIHHKLAVYYEEKFKEDTAPVATLLAHHWCKVAEDLDTSAEVVIKAASYLSIAGMQALFLRQKKEALSFVAKGIKLMQAHRHFLTPGSEYENTYKELKSFLRLVNQ
ncbi:Adenylate cyclase type 10, variant 2 [Balamuthia mandrillaris]